MSEHAQTAAILRDIQRAVIDIQKRVENLEESARYMQQQAGSWSTSTLLSPISTNLSNIREMFLLEILRQKGLLDGVDLVPIESQVRERLAGKSIPWGAGRKSAEKNLERMKREIAGDYSEED